MSEQSTNALKESLASSLLRALESIVKVAEEDGIDINLPSDIYDVVWFKDVGGRGEQQRITRSEPSFHGLLELLEQLKAHEPAGASLQNLAKEAASILESGSWPVAGGPRPSPDGLAEHLVLSYLKQQRAFLPERVAVARTCSAFVDDTLSKTIRVTSIYLIENFNAQAEFQLDDRDLFRPIAADDFDQFGAVAHGQWLGFDRPWLSSNHWICQASDDGPKDSYEAPNRRFDHIEEILGALNLTAPGRVNCRLLLSRLTSPFFGEGGVRSQNILYSGGSGEKVVLDEAGVERFKKNYQLVKTVFGEPRLERLKLPFRRLRAASYRREDEDRLVDYVIGLERLLAPDSSTLEVTFRFSLRGAAILPSTFGDAADRKRFMSELYKLRSDVVHGAAKVAKTSKVSEMLPRAEAALRAVFLWFGSALLDNGDVSSRIQELDCSLIEGGSAWAQSFSP
ncbi:MAG: HEPN domain-containing protein [Chloroflexota bacterium]|nr:HEPN domain-containing protein [Chloroflexota bacterium]